MSEENAMAALKQCGATNDLIHRLGSDEVYARRVATFMGLADRHPRIWVSTTGAFQEICVHCRKGMGLMCASCEQNLRVP